MIEKSKATDYLSCMTLQLTVFGAHLDSLPQTLQSFRRARQE